MSEAIVPVNEAELGRLAEKFWNSSFKPASAKSARDVGLILMAGRDAGLNYTQACQNVMILNGRPAIWGDAMWALVLNHPEFAGKHEQIIGRDDERTYEVTLSRRKMVHGEAVTLQETGRFSVADAKRAKLWGKSGPWSAYPDRMLKIRARTFAARDLFSDAIGGMGVVEEQQDVQPVVSMQVIDTQAAIDALPVAADATPETSDDGAAFLASLEDH